MASAVGATAGTTVTTVPPSTQGSAGVASLLSLFSWGFGNSGYSYMAENGILHEIGR
jgi:hypothetical protein